MDKLDTLGRGTFHHIAAQAAVRPTNRELRWLAHIERHGPLSSVALLDLTADTHRCRDTGLRQLQKLRAGGWLSLPPQQRATERAEFHPYVYDITPKGRVWLQEKGLSQNSIRPSGHWWHTYAVSSLTSAFDRVAAAKSISFIPARTILDLRNAPFGIPYTGGTALPDQLFALDYGGSFRTFLLEVDRGTEPMASKAARESLAGKVAAYSQIASRDLHRQHYGLKSPVVLLFTFLSQLRAQNFMAMLATHPHLAATTLVQVLPANDPMFVRATEYVSGAWSRVPSGSMKILEPHSS